MSNSLYTAEVRELLRSVGWPKGLVMDVIEYPHHLGLRFYRDNFITFGAADQVRIAEAVKQVMETVRGWGIPIYMEKMERVPDGV